MFPDNMLPEETNGDRLSGHLKHILVNTERLSSEILGLKPRRSRLALR
ncbi:MAG: hypothetical protein PX639_00550 [Microcystis sp. M49637_WE12]|jgi:hypothetical protein|nr:hypothetical protein [Microcystis sp. M49637_WE12]